MEIKGDNKTVESIKMWQQLMQDVHPVVEKELIKLALVLFQDAKSCSIVVSLPSEVKVYLEEYTGLKKYYNKYVKRYNKLHQDAAKKLATSVNFWMPCDRHGVRPRIEVFWQ